MAKQFESVMVLPNQNNSDLIVRGKACVPGIFHALNFNYAVENIKTWIRSARMTTDKLVLCSAGPSLESEKYLTLIKELKENKNVKIACVKHALPVLISNGIIPDYCVVLDPRSIDGVSTQGSKRKNLYEAAAPFKEKITFLVASITDYSTTKYLVDNKFKVVGWNCVLQGFKDSHWLKPHIDFGSCAAVRAIQLFEVLGFRQFFLFGYDSSFENPTPEKIKKDKLDFVKTTWDKDVREAPSFWVKGELGVQAQELCYIILNRKDLLFSVLCDGFIGRCWFNLRNNLAREDYKEILQVETSPTTSTLNTTTILFPEKADVNPSLLQPEILPVS